MAETEDQVRTLPSDLDDPIRMNQELIKTFQDALHTNPAADLLSLVGHRYLTAHRLAQYEDLSEAGRYNLRTINSLHDWVLDSPEINLREKFPPEYDRRYKWAMPKTPAIPSSELQTEEPQDWLRGKLEEIETASIIYPLSDQASALLQNVCQEKDISEGTSLATSLKKLIFRSERLFELSIRGAVLKCSDELAIKLFPDSRDLTEYHTLQYLSEHIPDLPVPRSHGLIMLGTYRAMFMSCIPGVRLDKVWPGLSTDAKLSLQTQLDQIFSRLRSLRQDDGLELGGVDGGGVKDYRIMEVFTKRGITTARGFDELQFSAKHRASPSYVKLLRSFLEKENRTIRGSVFTHGDLKKSNIMVQQDVENEGALAVTAIIDWEDSGFYPDYYECTTLSNGQSIMSDDDWYLYVPECISPQRHPVRWLVDRLWGNLLWSWRTDIVR
ncbi:kinase-like protein [Aspergillus crustosus]